MDFESVEILLLLATKEVNVPTVTSGGLSPVAATTAASATGVPASPTTPAQPSGAKGSTGKGGEELKSGLFHNFDCNHRKDLFLASSQKKQVPTPEQAYDAMGAKWPKALWDNTESEFILMSNTLI